MSIDGWFENHKDVTFTIEHPKTKAGHKTDIEMWSNETSVKVFRESITYRKITDDEIVRLLNDMYRQIKKIETELRIRENN